MDYEVVKESKDRAEGSKTRAEGSSKRAGEDLQQEFAKKQKMDDDKEKEELKQYFEIVPDDGYDASLDTVYWMEIVFLQNVDQSILYGVSADVDTTYSSKSGDGLDLV
ncbi:hypothetical protein Tco_0801401 [Tanacetum coccineum]|uniref:Uncharacterized protein n=1 Tax=Tanacetum coccineum TaxID=301880 RepID=A0ABQ5A080_9ASTR